MGVGHGASTEVEVEVGAGVDGTRLRVCMGSRLGIGVSGGRAGGILFMRPRFRLFRSGRLWLLVVVVVVEGVWRTLGHGLSVSLRIPSDPATVVIAPEGPHRQAGKPEYELFYLLFLPLGFSWIYIFFFLYVLDFFFI